MYARKIVNFNSEYSEFQIVNFTYKLEYLFFDFDLRTQPYPHKGAIWNFRLSFHSFCIIQFLLFDRCWVAFCNHIKIFSQSRYPYRPQSGHIHHSYIGYNHAYVYLCREVLQEIEYRK